MDHVGRMGKWRGLFSGHGIAHGVLALKIEEIKKKASLSGNIKFSFPMTYCFPFSICEMKAQNKVEQRMTTGSEEKSPTKCISLTATCYAFWRWVYLLAEKKSKQIHLKRHGNDIKCPRCKEWFSVSGLKYNHTFGQENDLFIVVRCGQCGCVSNWSPNIAPVLVRVDNDGNPVEAQWRKNRRTEP